jgi:hypothetical protein
MTTRKCSVFTTQYTQLGTRYSPLGTRSHVTSVLRRVRFLLTSKLRYRNILNKTLVEAQSIDVQGFVGPPLSRESSRRQTDASEEKSQEEKEVVHAGGKPALLLSATSSPASTTRQNQAALTSGLFRLSKGSAVKPLRPRIWLVRDSARQMLTLPLKSNYG